MNIRRWLLRRGPLIVATLAITAGALMSPVPASAGPASLTNVSCSLTVNTPRQNTSGSLVTADAYVFCFGGFPSAINLSLILTRDGVVVDSVLTGSTGALTAAACVPGNYVALGSATIWYPPGNIPSSDSFRWSSPSVYISCVAVPQPLAVTNPGSRSTFYLDPASLQMTATGGTAPYTWSASGLPTGLSINASTGLISGVVRAVGTFTVTVTAVDAAGRSASTQFSWSVKRECTRC